MFMEFVRLTLILAFALSTEAFADEALRPLPISAHNCYPQNRTDNPRLTEALALGIDNIEIDLGWDDAAKQLIIGHDAKPRPDVAYPRLDTSLIPALISQQKVPRPDGAPTILTIDWKTSRPEAVLQFKEFLDAHADWFSSAPKAADSPLRARRLTVCFSGSEAAKAAYDALIPVGGTYRAFRDRVVSGIYADDVATYVPGHSTAYLRFLAFHWGTIERGAPARAGEWTPAENARLSSLIALAHRRGFRVRVYCLNGHSGPLNSSYRFADDNTAKVRWLAAAAAGVDWIAGDEYKELVDALRAKPKSARP
jgi:hypothetical protein